jgi:hypothetical protein
VGRKSQAESENGKNQCSPDPEPGGAGTGLQQHQPIAYIAERSLQILGGNALGQPQAPQLLPQIVNLGFYAVQAFHHRLEAK